MKIKIFVMLPCLLKILKYQSLVNTKKSEKSPIIIDADFESLLGKLNGCKNNLENSSTRNFIGDTPSGFLMSEKQSFKDMQNKHDVYRGKGCTKKFIES